MQIKKILCKSALNRINNKFLPYKWDLNIYRGCQHSCNYCYALYSHNYLDNNNFFDSIHVKTNIVDKLEEKLKSKSWKSEIINIGGVTDSYQELEKDYKLMPDILKLLIKYRNPIIISTKSDLILRDIEYIDKLSNLTYVNIASTITTTNTQISSKLEAKAPSPEKRFNVLKEFKRTNASVGLHAMPITPLLSDSYEDLDNLFSMANMIKVDYMLTGILYLRGKTKPHFFNFIKNNFPDLLNTFKILYSNGSLDKTFKTTLYNRIRLLKEKYNLSSDFNKTMMLKLKKPEDRYYSNLLF